MLKGLPTVKFIADDKEGGGNNRPWTLWFNSLAGLLRGVDTNAYGLVLPSGITTTGLIAKDYVDDAAAAAAGVPLGGEYHTAGVKKIRIV